MTPPLPLVFFPGLDGAHHSGNEILLAFNDRPTFQLTYPSTKWKNMDEIVRAARETLQQRGISRFDLAGESMGGALAQLYTATYPTEVRRLVGISTFLKNPQPIIGRMVGLALRRLPPWVSLRIATVAARRLITQGLGKVEEEKFLATLKEQNFADIGWRLKALVGFRHGASLKRLQPTIWIWGSLDPLVPWKRVAAELQAARPHEKQQVITGAGHVVSRGYRDQIVAVIREFLSAPEASASASDAQASAPEAQA